MELRQLRYFREVVRLGSFRRAAEGLFITQPALTKSIRTLEEELGVQLLERGARGVVVTAFGKILADCADSVAGDIGRATAEIEAMTGSSGGVVRVGGMTTVMQWILPGAIRRLGVETGEIRVIASVALLSELVGQLARGEIDVGLCTLYPWHHSDAIAGERVLTDEVVIVADARHPLANRPALDLAELGRFRWVLPGQGDAWRRRLFEDHRNSGLPDPDVAVEVGSAALMARMLEGSTMLSMVPRRLLGVDAVFGALRPLDLRLDWPPFEVYLAQRKAAVMLPATRRFIEALKASCAG